METITNVNGLVNGGLQGRTTVMAVSSHSAPSLPLDSKGNEALRPTFLTANSDPVPKKSPKLGPKKYLYKPRDSLLDRHYMYRTEDSLRGFFTLFWIAMSFFIILTFVHNFEKDGSFLQTTFYDVISKDALGLIWSDFVMVSFTLFCVPFAKLQLWGWVKYNTIGMILQHIFQCAFLGLNIYWTFFRDWPWVQSGFFTLHTIVMMMKCHSYTTLNGELSEVYHHYKIIKKRYDELTGLEKKADDDSKHTSELKQLQDEIKELEEHLTTGKTRYPDNVTMKNYLDYLVVPTLVYDLEYPRKESINVPYVLEKTAATLGTFLVLYTTTEHYILPTLYNPDIPEWRVILELLFPFMINYLLIFYIIFECICNWFAEVSRFADRNFYDDWWNSTTYDTFARKWNKPVHNFLLRHVYSPTLISNLGPNPRNTATFLTFLLSSCIHELVMVITSKKIRMYLFAFQMFQLPLIWVGRLPAVRSSPTLGNFLFWLGMFVGPPLLGILYCREVFWSKYFDLA